MLSATHITKDIIVNQLDNIMASITTRNFLGFNDEELPSEVRIHNKSLHILLTCIDTLISRVLVDIRSSLKVILKTTLLKLSSEWVIMKPNTLIIKAFDGSRRGVIREVDLRIRIGPTTFTITFQVVDIHPAYNCLLGRPLIHSVGTIIPTLHHKLKFINNNKMIVIGGEEDILVIHLTSFRYIDVDGETNVILFQSLEVLNVLTVQLKVEQSKSEPSMASWKGAKAIMEAGNVGVWGKLMEVHERRTGSGWDTNHP